jgi:uncharacterized RDD family membrane protein YckC
MPNYAQGSTDRYAGFWIRLGAYLIDYMIIQFATSMLFGFLALIFGFAVGSQTSDFSSSSFESEGEALLIIGCYFGIIILTICGQWLYYALFESSSMQATPGKLAVGIKVVDYEKNRLSFGKATGRHFAKIISAFTLSIGYMMAGWTEKKQTLHDMVAGTLVVRK